MNHLICFFFLRPHHDGTQTAHVPKQTTVGSGIKPPQLPPSIQSEIITEPTGLQEHNHGRELNLYRFALPLVRLYCALEWGCQPYFSFIMAACQTLTDSMRLRRQRYGITSLICCQSRGRRGFYASSVTTRFAKSDSQVFQHRIIQRHLEKAVRQHSHYNGRPAGAFKPRWTSRTCSRL